MAMVNRKTSARPNPTLFSQISSSITTPNAIKYVARREIGLLNSKENPDKNSTVLCPSIGSKPFLDGKFDEPLWQQLKEQSIQLAGDARLGDTEIQLVRDEQYLYIRIRATKKVKSIPRVENAKRHRDPSFQNSEHITLRLDLDRDFETWFELSVDRRGHVAESINGNRKWDPTWYVARAETDSQWSIEAAIPLKELVGESTNQIQLHGNHWGFSASRSFKNHSVHWPHRSDSRPLGTLSFQ